MHRKPLPVGQVLNEEEVIVLVWGLEDWYNDAVDVTEDEKGR